MSIKTIFFNGIKVFLPVAVTFATVYWVFNTIETFFGNLIKLWLPPQFYFLGLGTLIGVLLVCTIGALVNAWLVKQIYQLINWFMLRTPFIRTIYNAMLDLITFFDKKETEAQQAVVVDTPMGKIIGFVTRSNLSALPKSLSQESNILVYIPFSYQIGGFTLSMPYEKVELLDMPVNEAMSFVITAGLTGFKNKKV